MQFKNNQLVLAPMAGVTDSVVRMICKEQGADIVFSEMVSAEGLFYGSKATRALMEFEETERPIGIQLFGADPDHLAHAAAFVQDTCKPDFIDLNSGCPVPKVVKKNGGSALLRDRDLFRKIITAMTRVLSIPLTVKIRSGWNKHVWVDVEFAKIAEDAGAAAITVHPRSQTMGFSGHSFWERIAEVKKAVSIPVIGNGDIITAQDALKMFEETGCDSVMIGRGAYGNPWIFRQIKEHLQGAPPSEPSIATRVQTACDHIERFISRYGEIAATRLMKKHIAWYIKGVPEASQYRNRIFRSQSTAELTDALNGIMESTVVS